MEVGPRGLGSTDSGLQVRGNAIVEGSRMSRFQPRQRVGKDRDTDLEVGALQF